MESDDARTLAGDGLTRVLLGTDFSAGARAALHRTALIPLGRKARVVIAHVRSESPARLQHEKATARTLLADEATLLRRRLALHGRSDVSVRTSLIPVGQAHEGILALARATRSQLIVVGRHGRGPRALLIGSTAEKVVRARAVPVLVVGARPRHRYRRPLVALDPASELGPSALEPTLRLLGPGTGKVDVASAYQLFSEGQLRRGGASSAEILRWRRSESIRARRLVEQMLRGFPAQGARLVPSVHRGDPRQAVLRFALRRGTDLIALGTHARRGLARFLLGSVAAEVLRSARCDVLLVPPAGR
jgi:nucleotide-binding universal stress UspA family protein